MKHVLILGGDGYLGWPTAMYFSAKGYKVTVVDNYFRTRDVITADLSNYINDTSITEFEGELLPYALAN